MGNVLAIVAGSHIQIRSSTRFSRGRTIVRSSRWYRDQWNRTRVDHTGWDQFRLSIVASDDPSSTNLNFPRGTTSDWCVTSVISVIIASCIRVKKEVTNSTSIFTIAYIECFWNYEDSTWRNESKKRNKYFRFEAPFPRKSSLNVYRF